MKHTKHMERLARLLWLTDRCAPHGRDWSVLATGEEGDLEGRLEVRDYTGCYKTDPPGTFRSEGGRWERVLMTVHT